MVVIEKCVYDVVLVCFFYGCVVLFVSGLVDFVWIGCESLYVIVLVLIKKKGGSWMIVFYIVFVCCDLYVLIVIE